MSRHHQKRSRSGKDVASSSTPVFPYQDGSYLKFLSQEEYTRFMSKFESRDILPPRFSTTQFLESNALAANMLREAILLIFFSLHIHTFIIHILELFIPIL